MITKHSPAIESASDMSQGDRAQEFSSETAFPIPFFVDHPSTGYDLEKILSGTSIKNIIVQGSEGQDQPPENGWRASKQWEIHTFEVQAWCSESFSASGWDSSLAWSH